MKGLLFFEAAAISTTLTGEPNVVVAGLILAKLAYNPILDDYLFYIFFGALCITLVAKLFDWKTKRDNLLSNILEATSVALFSCVLLPMLGIDETLRRLCVCAFYVLVTQRGEPITILFGLHLLEYVYKPKTPEELLSIVVYYTLFFGCFHISIWMWRKRDRLWNFVFDLVRILRIRRETTHTVPDPSDNTHDHNE